MQVFDIGANYGVYTLPMAKSLVSRGALWAFKPSSKTAAYLNGSLAENGFDNFELIQAALSNIAGTACLTSSPMEQTSSVA